MSKNIVIIPTYNEIENIEDIIGAVIGLSTPFDILIVDDSSPDETANIVIKLQQKYTQLHLLVRKNKEGLGKAYIDGFLWALDKNYEYICEMDADFSHNPQDLIKLHNACVENNMDMVIGSRYIQGVNVINWPMNRVIMSYMAGVYVRFITGLPIMDVTSGFKCYHKTALEKISLKNVKLVGYGFQIEMKFLAWKKKCKIIEIPIVFTDRTKGKSKMSINIFNEAFFGVFWLKFQSLFKKV